MADTINGKGRILPGEQFEFSLDGISTAAQMDKLIKLTDKMLKVWDPTHTSSITKETKKTSEGIKDLGDAVAELTEAEKARLKAIEDFNKGQKKTSKAFNQVSEAAHSLATGGYKGALYSMNTASAKFALVVGTVVGSLAGYADKLTEGLQRGISGGIFDYAIAAKTAGVSIEQFGKAIAETAGGFASLGTGATDGAKQFASLVSEVRYATKEVGNLGMTNEQIAMFTAQQTKTAISQGFKGKQAQEVVIKNSRALGEELDMLANRTGKSVMELAAAAMKLAQDPLVANFIQTAKQGGDQISKSVQKFGASLRAVFGEAGESLASDTLKAALSNLPLVMTQAGKNMILASSTVYSELERQARIIKQGGELTEQDQEKLRNTVLAEVKARGEELRTLSMLEGPMGESAKQLLALAEQANFYNSEEGRKRREEDKRAQQYNAAMRQFQANMQALAIPLLELINGINWNAFINILSGFAKVVEGLLSPFTLLGKILGVGNFGGSIIGGLLGFGAVIGMIVAAHAMYRQAITASTVGLMKFARTLNQMFPGSGIGLATTAAGRKAGGKVGGALGTIGGLAGGLPGMIGGGLGMAGAGLISQPTTGAGEVGSLVGGLGGQLAGAALLGPAIGRLLGGALGSLAGPIGTAAGSALGAAAGSWLGGKIGDGISGSSTSELGSIGPNQAGTQLAQDNNTQLKKIASVLDASRDDAVAGNVIATRQLREAAQANSYARIASMNAVS